MDLTSYERLIKTENAARKYLLGFYFENHQRFCPRCKENKLYRLADDRRRCSSCRYTFHDFSGRWINQGNLAAGQWLRLIKLIELELSIRKITQQLRLSDNSASSGGSPLPRIHLGGTLGGTARKYPEYFARNCRSTY